MNRVKFKAIYTYRGYNVKGLARLLNLNEITVYKKMREDGFTIAEAKILVDALDIKNPSEIFFDVEEGKAEDF